MGLKAISFGINSELKRRKRKRENGEEVGLGRR
jgi:hypothetical protein